MNKGQPLIFIKIISIFREEFTPFSASNSPTKSAAQKRSNEQIEKAKHSLEKVLASSDSVLEEVK
jgi:hypothetical protein